MPRGKLGIIQSRGLGDLVIALPIAGYYRDQGWEIYWPIVESFVPSMASAVPWVHWIPITTDPTGRYFYDVPLKRLRNLGCDQIMPLYQHLTGHDFCQERYFQATKFDQYKYIRAGVPFLHKWRLAEYITRHRDREQAVYDRVVHDVNYVVVHLQGSDHRAAWDSSMVPAGWQIIEIAEQPRTLLFDWLKVIEHAQSLVMVDSVYANITDQLGLGTDRYFIPRSHVGLTPVQGQDWTWL